MLADLRATIGERFDTIDERQQDSRLDNVADRLLAVEKKASGIDRRLDAREHPKHPPL
jgi:hypothetical protein